MERHMLKQILRNMGKVALYSVILTSIVAIFAVTAAFRSFQFIASNNLPALVSGPSTLTTDTWGLFDVESGKVLTGNNVTKGMPIASVTKLFTAEAVLRSAKKDEKFYVTYPDIATEGRAGKLYYGEEVTPYTLLFPLLIESSNDAGVAIKRHLGDEYTSSIDLLKTDLNLSSTTISDPTGLSSRDYSSVSDLSKFYAYLKHTHPHILDITQLRMYIDDNSGYINNDPAREFTNFKGGKHGYTDEAGRTFVGSFMLDGKEVGVVLLHSSDLRHDLSIILDYGKSYTQ
jgi:D-alanyl-D-alanine carboxypeptidase (penicillin-binding protein 5/6)